MRQAIRALWVLWGCVLTATLAGCAATSAVTKPSESAELRQVYAIHEPTLTCEQANQISYRTVERLGYTVVSFTPAAPGGIGILKGTREGADGRPEPVSVQISCVADGVHVDANAESPLDVASESALPLSSTHHTSQLAASGAPPPRVYFRRAFYALFTGMAEIAERAESPKPQGQIQVRMTPLVGLETVLEFGAEVTQVLPVRVEAVNTTRRDAACAAAVVKTVAEAIIDYRRKRLKELPPWLDEFQFQSEETLRFEIEALLSQTSDLQSQLQHWKGYKAILTTSGDLLKGEVVKVLENFFGVRVDPTDQNREDAKILDDQGGVLAMVEIKGTTKGIKREYINQVDSHRERNELPPSMPGILLINNEMSIEGITQRLATAVAEEQIKHAQNFNVLIVRTIDLLFLMKHFENDPERKDKLLKLLSSGGGWLSNEWC